MESEPCSLSGKHTTAGFSIKSFFLKRGKLLAKKLIDHQKLHYIILKLRTVLPGNEAAYHTMLKAM